MNYHQYKCTACDRLFKNSYDVQWHVGSAHGSEPIGVKYGQKLSDKDIPTQLIEDLKITDPENYPTFDMVKAEMEKFEGDDAAESCGELD